MSDAKLRVVLDTNQIVGAGSRWLDNPAANPNDHRRLLVRVAEMHTGLYCDRIIEEYLAKLLDRGHPANRAQRLATYIMGAFTIVEVTSSTAPVRPSDLDDEIFLLCSLDGNADYLVSEDSDLLDLKPSYPRPVIGKCSDLMGALGV